jgi:5'-3' exonuclease|tara:strand:+ start:4942 stop:5982 length:1041 start_codon:yes stop_codon:yes gene_type:complete
MANYSNILNNLKETPPREVNDHILVIDAMNMLIRSFSLLKAMNPSGHHIGGLVGFLRSLGYVTRTFDPTRVVIVWDGKGGSGNRKNIDPNYKANRATNRITHWGLYDTKAEETEALIAQLYRTMDYIEHLPVQQIILDKLEADDIIAYIGKQASFSNSKKLTIVSSDKDFLQLVDDTIEVYSPIKKVLFTKDNIAEELKVDVTNYNVVKALLGDNSDNLAGVKGLGIKTIIKEFPKLVTEPNIGLEYVYEVCEGKLDGKKIFPKIITEWDRVETNFELMDLHKTVLDDKEKEHVMEVIKAPIPTLRVGVFLSLLEIDKIEGITKNTEGWLENFRRLTTVNEKSNNS